MYWQPTRADMEYVIRDNNNAAIFDGEVHDVDPGYNSGFRLGVGYGVACGWDLTFLYTDFQSRTAQAQDLGAGQSFFATRVHPNLSANAANANFARADAAYDVDLRRFDVEAGYSFSCGNAATLRPFGGVRVELLDERFAANYSSHLFVPGASTLVTDTLASDAVGMYGGAEGRWWLFGSPVAVVGRFSGSVEVGQFNIRSREEDFSPNALNVDVRKTEDRVYATIEAALGVRFPVWSVGWVTVEGELGYEAIQYSGLPGFISFDDGTADGSIDVQSSDLGFHGGYARGYVRW